MFERELSRPSNVHLSNLAFSLSCNSAARGGKVASLKATYAEYADQFEAFSIADIASDQFPEALEGVDAVIHSAAPIAEKASSPEILLEVCPVH